MALMLPGTMHQTGAQPGKQTARGFGVQVAAGRGTHTNGVGILWRSKGHRGQCCHLRQLDHPDFRFLRLTPPHPQVLAPTQVLPQVGVDHHGLIFHSPSQSQLRGALSQTPGQGEHVPRGRQQVRVTPGSQGRRGHARGDHTGPAHVCARFKSWWRAVMVTSVAELSKRRTGDPTRR